MCPNRKKEVPPTGDRGRRVRERLGVCPFSPPTAGEAGAVP